MVVYVGQCFFLNSSHPLLPPPCPQVRSLHLHLHLSVTLQGLCRWKLRSQISWSKSPWWPWSNQVSPLSLSLEFWSREVRENYCERRIQHKGRDSIAGGSYGRGHGARVMVNLRKLREHPHWQPAKKRVLHPTTIKKWVLPRSRSLEADIEWQIRTLSKALTSAGENSVISCLDFWPMETMSW